MMLPPRMTGCGGASYYNIGAAAIVVVTTMLCSMVQWSNAKSVDVGGTAGWTSFESSRVTSPNYGAWASSQKFYSGDSLVFKFAAGAHNVWKLQSRAAYQSCDFSGATLLDGGDSGFYIWKATQPGEYFFSCDKGAEGVGTHCDYNQKLAIIVSQPATTPTSAPSPNPNITAPSPISAPPPNPYSIAPSPTSAPSPSPPNPNATAPSPTSAPSPSSPNPNITAPSPLPHPPSVSPVPWSGPAPAPFHSSPPSKPPLLAPSSSSSPSPSPSPSPKISPVPSPSISPSPSPPSPLSPDSSPPSGGEPTALVSPSQNGGMFRSAQSSSSSLLFSVALVCVLLW